MSEQDRQDMTRKPAYNVELHIDEIVLHGFAHRDRYTIQEVLQRELTRLLADGGLPSLLHQSIDASRLDAGAVMMHKGMSPSDVGIQVAQSVYRGLAQNNEQPVNGVDNGRSEQK